MLNKSTKDVLTEYFKQQGEVYGKDYWSKNIIDKIQDSVTVNKGSKDQILGQFNEKISSCVQCSLGHTRTKFVFGVGNPDADIMLVGEAPGRAEDLQGIPFVGRSGKLLDEILYSKGKIGLDRTKVYIANILKCRPPENRNPLPEEIDLCEPYLKEQINIIQPRLIIALGKVAANTLLKNNDPLGDLRMKTHKYNGIDLRVTYHPAALLRNPGLKKKYMGRYERN